MLTHLVRYQIVSLFSFAAGWYLRILSRKTQPGRARLLLCIPLFAYNLCVPLLFHPEEEYLSASAMFINYFWAANFKALAFCMGRGPLCQPLSFTHFVLTYGLPINPQQKEHTDKPSIKSSSRLGQYAGGAGSLMINLLGKVALQACLLLILTSEYAANFPTMLSEILISFLLYTFLGILMDLTAAIITKLASLPCSPHFDQPYLSESIGDFWSRRWNLTIGNTLRTVVYDPIHEGRLIPSTPGYTHSRTRSACGVCAAFAVSGLMHWVIFRLLILDFSIWGFPWFVFFTIQGPIIIVEQWILKFARGKGLLPPIWLRIPLTIVILWWTAHEFLFPPSIAAQLPERFYNCVLGTVQPLLLMVQG